MGQEEVLCALQNATNSSQTSPYLRNVPDAYLPRMVFFFWREKLIGSELEAALASRLLMDLVRVCRGFLWACFRLREREVGGGSLGGLGANSRRDAVPSSPERLVRRT